MSCTLVCALIIGRLGLHSYSYTAEDDNLGDQENILRYNVYTSCRDPVLQACCMNRPGTLLNKRMKTNGTAANNGKSDMKKKAKQCYEYC